MTKISTIFLIDDDNDDREIFEAVLSEVDNSIELKTANDGIDAFEKLNSGEMRNIDLIFLDINMPKMDGVEFLEKVKKHREFAKVPVIIYSTSNHDHFIDKTLSLGAISYMTKATSFEALSESLKKILDLF